MLTAPPAAGPRDGCGSGSCGCGSQGGGDPPVPAGVLDKPMDRRRALGTLFGAAVLGTQAAGACSPVGDPDGREAALLAWEEYFKGNFRLMTAAEKAETIRRLERLAERPLGAWRSAVFFLLFFAQLLAAMQLMALLIGDAGRGNAT